MNLYDLFGVGERLWPPLVLALLHSIWQASLAVVLLALGLRLMRIQYAGARATLCGLAQISVLVAFLLTWAILSAADQKSFSTKITSANPTSSTTISQTQSIAPAIDQPNTKSLLSPSPAPPLPESTNWPRLIAFAWIAGAIFMVLRMAHDLAAGWTLVRRGTDGSDVLVREVNRLRDQFGLWSPIRVVVSERNQTPAIFGVLRPILLFPAAPIGLPPEQLEAILAHELAHIKRRDWLWHFIGRLIEAVLFYNPGVWWLGRLARREREAAADALAVRITCEPAVFATALAEWAGRSQQPAKAALAWDGDSGGLRERVLRVLKPTHQPRVRFSPVGMALALLAAVLILAVLRGGAGRAVAMAQELLSPEERIERIEEVKVAVEENANSEENQKENQPVKVRGKVSTADGVPLSETSRGGSGVVATIAPGYSYIGTVGAKGEFSRTLSSDGDHVTITAHWPGYAPTVIGPASISSHGDRIDLEIVLKRGFEARVELLDSNGDRIRQAEVEASLSHPANSQPTTLTLAENGLFALEHCAVYPYDITVEAPGFAREKFDSIELTADGIASLKLTPTKSTTGIVTNKAGKPLANVKIRLHAAGQSNTVTQLWSLRSGAVLDTTGQDGRFSLTSLFVDKKSVVLCEREGMGMAFAVVEPGQADVEIRLGPERVLRGEVIGDLSALTRRHVGGNHPVPSLQYSISYIKEIPDSSLSMGSAWGGNTEVVPDPTSGNPPQRGTFTIDGMRNVTSLPRGTITIQAAETEYVVQPFNGVKNITIDLSKPFNRPYRDIAIRFVPPDASNPPARGRVQVHLVSRDEKTGEQNWRSIEVPLQNGQIRFEALVSARVWLDSAGLIGYWFDSDAVGHVDLPGERGQAQGFLVPEGQGLFEYKIDVIPAGAIRAHMASVQDPAPLDLDELEILSWRVDTSDGDRRKFIVSAPSNGNGDALVTPVPMDGVYELSVPLDNATVVRSPKISVTRENPLPEVMLEIPELTSRTVRVVDAAGRPVDDAQVEITRSYPGLARTAFGRTDEHGMVTLDTLEADALGEYRVQAINDRNRPISETKDLQSKTTVLTINAGDGNPSG